MKIRENIGFKLVCLFTAITFILQSFCFYQPALAEIPCWNDGTKIINNGGSVLLAQAPKGNPNPQGTEKVADPVNLATGNYAYEHQDLFIPSRGLPLEFRRFYNSQDSYDGPLGIGWSHSYNIFLIEAGDTIYKLGIAQPESYVIRRNPDGNKDKFLRNPDGTYTAPPGVFDTLAKNAQGYLITTKSGLRYQFNLIGYLASITDRNNNQLSLTYDATTGVLTNITDAIGRALSLEYTPERKLSQLRDFSGRTYKYGYADGNLVSVTAPATPDSPTGATTTYTYSSHKLISITDPKGNTYLNISYDTQERVTQLTQGLFNTYNFSYSQNLTTVIDPKGNRTDYQLNDDGTVKKKVEYTPGLNLETTYTYNLDKLPTQVISPKGNSIEYTYDTKGNLLNITRKPLPGSSASNIITTFTYEPRYNFIKTSTDPKANTTTYYYDYEEASLGDLNADGITNQDRGNLVKLSYPQVTGGTPQAKFTYNLYGQLETITDPNGNITKYAYYPDTGYLKQTIQAFGSLNITTEFTYDAVGNVKTITDPKGNTTSFNYDSHNNLIWTNSSLPFSYITNYRYDANDNLIQTDRQTGDPGNPWQTTYYSYDNLDRLLTIQDESGNTTTFSYDANGNRSLIQDAELNSTLYEYDARNLLSKVTDALGNITAYSYDNNGNLKEIKDSKGNKTLYTYDDFNRLIRTTYADSSFEEYTYDVNSNLITKKDPKAQTITYSYDVLNRLTSKLANEQTTYTYDLGSRLIDVIDVTGTIHYNYDNANRITQVSYPGAKSVAYEYDANSNRTRLTYPDSTFITYTYDELNRLTAITQDSQLLAQYSYDSLSRRTQLNLANSTQILYQYDNINRLIQLANRQIEPPANFSQYDYTYDKVGNRKTMTTLQGTHSYTYDKIYQLTQLQTPNSQLQTYNYDPVGNRLSTTNGGTVNYSPNNLNQYTQVGTTNYTYDANGNLTSDGTFTYAYDYENRLISATKTGIEVTYKYDPFGRRTQKRNNASNAITNFIYDGDQLIAAYDASGNLTTKYIYGPGIDKPIRMEKGGASYYYHFDGLGSVTNLTDSSGTVIESYSYDAFGKPNTASSLGNRFMFTGREYDSETGLYYYRERYYSPALGRFLQRDPLQLDDENTYTYTYNDPVNWIDPYGYQGMFGVPDWGPTGWGLPGGWKPGPGDLPLPGGDIGLPRPPIPGGLAPPNPKRKDKPLIQQQGVSENVTQAATEGAKEKGKDKKPKEPKKETDRKIKDVKKNPQDWEQIDKKKDPKGNSWRELWKNKKTGELLERHDKYPDPKGRHPHWGPVEHF